LETSLSNSASLICGLLTPFPLSPYPFFRGPSDLINMAFSGQDDRILHSLAVSLKPNLADTSTTKSFSYALVVGNFTCWFTFSRARSILFGSVNWQRIPGPSCGPARFICVKRIFSPFFPLFVPLLFWAHDLPSLFSALFSPRVGGARSPPCFCPERPSLLEMSSQNQLKLFSLLRL